MLMAQPNGSVFAPMANLRVTCDCGAIYEVIETVNCTSSDVLTRIANNAQPCATLARRGIVDEH